MEHFSLSKYLRGGYELTTRDGHAARIICTDAKGPKPIVALVLYDSTETAYQYDLGGQLYYLADSKLDLFLLYLQN